LLADIQLDVVEIRGSRQAIGDDDQLEAAG
jgi:hypothetical protein